MPHRGRTFAICGLTILCGARCPTQPSPGWRRTLTTSEAGGVNYVVAAGPSFVAVGSVASGRVAWTSSDGEVWNVHPLSGSGLVYAVAAYPGGVVAVGFGIWTSSDGTSWTQVLAASQGTVFRDVVHHDGQTIAVGNTTTGNVTQAVVWRSTDPALVNWTRVFAEPGTSLPQSPSLVTSSQLRAVTATSDAIRSAGGPAFVAAGSKEKWVLVYNSWDYDADAAVWTSVDGINWRLASMSDPAFAVDNSSYPSQGTQSLSGVMVKGRRFYTSGSDAHATDGTGSMIWWSLDAPITWTRMTVDKPEDLPAFQMRHTVHAIGSLQNTLGYSEIAVGEVGDYANADCGVWRGATGYPRWHRLSDPLLAAAGRQVCSSAAGKDDVLVVVGTDAGYPAIWTFARR